MTRTGVEELETLDEVALQAEDAAPVSPALLQHVVDAWEESTSGLYAESACTAAVREWEESDRPTRS